MQEVPRGIAAGALVSARGERWRVGEAHGGATAAVVTLHGVGERNRQRRATLLIPFDRVRPEPESRLAARRRLDLLAELLATAAHCCPAGALWTAPAARMELWPWQLAPALSVLNDGVTRLLLADAVGLGKTVQAGLILAELRARGLVERALVLSPAAVRAQWAAELTDRFALPARVLDQPALLDLEAAGPAGVNPWARAAVIVSSIDLVKRAEVRAAFDHAPIDLLIVDEAHHATPGTDRHAAVSRLARQAPWVVLVSATPHGGDPVAYDALLAIGRTAAGPPMRVFRRSHEDAAALVPRRARTAAVRPTGEEARLLAGILDYTRRLCRAASGSQATPLLAGILARRATSSPRAARLTLERRLRWLAGDTSTPAERDQPLPWEETDGEDDEGAWLAAPGLDDRRAERDAVADLVARARAAESAPSKLAWLARFVARVREPLIVFSEFRDTLDACLPTLEALAAVSCLHGDLDIAERGRRLSAFLRGDARILLTTDVAGEGLNLHQAARLVVTVEWPWSPLRLEQRIGRVHRLGQRRVVHAIHLTAAGSYESVVVSHLMARAARASAALERLAPSVDRSVAAHVFDLPGDRGFATEDAAVGTDAADVDRARAEATRATEARARDRAGRGTPTEGGWTLPPPGRESGRVVVLVEVLRHLAAGWPQSRQIVPVLLSIDARVRHRRLWREMAAQLARDARVVPAAVAHANGRGFDQWAGARERLRALATLRHEGRGRPLVQPSLFDRRALRSAARQAESDAVWDSWRRRLDMRLAAGPIVTTTRVLAVVPMADEVR